MKKDPLELFLPKKRKCRKKPVYTMIRFDKRPELLGHLLKRVEALCTTKQDYMLALIAKDMAENEK